MSLNYYGSNSNHDTPTIDLEKYSVDLSKYIPKFIYNEKTLNKIYKAQEYELAFIYWCIDDLLKHLNQETINKLNEVNPIYISLSKYFFENNNKLITIEYETDMAISRITREDLY